MRLTWGGHTGRGLGRLETSVLAEGFQVSEGNPMLGVDSRAVLLRSLGESLVAHPEVFGAEGRPGKLVGGYLLLGFLTLFLQGADGIH